MCRIYAGQDSDRFEPVTRSIRLSGYVTSIRLETAFWEILDNIAATQGLSTPQFVSKLHEEVVELRGGVSNFTSMLRTTCLLHLRGAGPEADERAEIATPVAAE